MKTKFFYTILSFLISLLVSAQQAGISGKVTGLNMQPVTKASVSVLNTNLGAITDENGKFVLQNLSPGSYTLQVSAVGYAVVNKDVAVSATGNQSVDIQLNISSTQLDAVTVTAQKREEALQKIPFSISALSSRKVQEYRLWNNRELLSYRTFIRLILAIKEM
jgi:iron complex outermembrane recepter protein